MVIEKDFNTFRGSVEKWCEKFGLHDWEVMIKSGPVEADFAETIHSYIDKVATITLDEDHIVNDYITLDHIAQHEVLEILLAPLNHLATKMGADHLVLASEVHSAIHRIQKVINDPVIKYKLTNEYGDSIINND